jgi:hypothetical protein
VRLGPSERLNSERNCWLQMFTACRAQNAQDVVRRIKEIAPSCSGATRAEALFDLEQKLCQHFGVPYFSMLDCGSLANIIKVNTPDLLGACKVPKTLMQSFIIKAATSLTAKPSSEQLRDHCEVLVMQQFSEPLPLCGVEPTMQNTAAAKLTCFEFEALLPVHGSSLRSSTGRHGSVGRLGKTSKDQALRVIEAAPLLSNLAQSTGWAAIFEPELGTLIKFLASRFQDASFRILLCPDGSMFKVPLSTEPIDAQGCESVSELLLRQLIVKDDQPASQKALASFETACTFVRYALPLRAEELRAAGAAMGGTLKTVLESPQQGISWLATQLSELWQLLPSALHQHLFLVFVRPLMALDGEPDYLEQSLAAMCEQSAAFARAMLVLAAADGVKGAAEAFLRLGERAATDSTAVSRTTSVAMTEDNQPADQSVAAAVASSATSMSEKSSALPPDGTAAGQLSLTTPAAAEAEVGDRDAAGPLRQMSCQDEDKCRELVAEIRHSVGMGCEKTPQLTALLEKLGRALKRLSIDLYSTDTHFVLELLQNADDNSYAPGTRPAIEFEVRPDMLIIKNNEIGFQRAHVKAICDVSNSTKKRGENKGACT